MTERPDFIPEAQASKQNERPSGKENGNGLEAREQDLLDLRKAVNKDPRNVVLLNELGLAAEANGDYYRARWAFSRATRLDPGYGLAYQNLGMLLWREGHHRGAIIALENCLTYAGRGCDRPAVESTLREMAQEQSKQTITKDDQLSEVFEPVPHDPELNQVVLPVEEEFTSPSTVDEASQSAPAAQENIISPAITRPMEALGLTPAEALMLLDPDGSDAQEMLRYTALDLVNKQVLEVKDSGQIGRGPNFETVELSRHEGFLANYFAHFNLDLDLARYSDYLLSRLDNRTTKYKLTYVRQVLLEKGYLRVEEDRWLGFFPVRRYVVTQDGLKIVHQLKRQLKNSQSQLRRLMRRDPELAKAYLAKAGPALLLLDDYSQEEFGDWRRMLAEMGFDESGSSNLVTDISKGSGDFLNELIKNFLGE